MMLVTLMGCCLPVRSIGFDVISMSDHLGIVRLWPKAGGISLQMYVCFFEDTSEGMFM